MSATRSPLKDAQELRHRATARGARLKHLDDAALADLLEHVGDIRLAEDAILLRPRPDWLIDILGHPDPGD